MVLVFACLEYGHHYTILGLLGISLNCYTVWRAKNNYGCISMNSNMMRSLATLLLLWVSTFSRNNIVCVCFCLHVCDALPPQSVPSYDVPHCLHVSSSYSCCSAVVTPRPPGHPHICYLWSSDQNLPSYLS